jgi:hypothetical protein
MTKVKTVEFWLFAIPVFVALAWVAGFTHELLPAVLGVWLLLAIFWMLRELVRRIFS